MIKEDNRFNSKDIKLNEWEFEFRQRNENPILMADFWSRSVFFTFSKELKLPAEYTSYMFTDTQRAYIKTKEKRKVLNLMRTAIKKESYLKYINDTTLSRLKEWELFVKSVEGRINDKKTDRLNLLKLWEDYDKNVTKLVPWFFIPWYVTEENMITDIIKKRLARHEKIISQYTDLANALMTLIFPVKEAHYQKEQRDFFRLMVMARNKENWIKDKNFLKSAATYLANYSWIKTYFILPIEPLSFAELAVKIKKSLKDNSFFEYLERQDNNKKNRKLAHVLLKGISKDKKLVRAIDWARQYGWLLTFSVEQAFKTSSRLLPFFKTIAKVIDVSYKDWVHLTYKEVAQVLEGGRKISPEIISERKKGWVLLMENGLNKIAAGEKGKRLSSWIDSNIGRKNSSSRQEITGQSAMPGMAKGRVRVILKPVDSNKLKKGEILVCSMTSPDYLPAMRRSAAIITDEGGLLSHAAIIARELKKPCIVKTRIVTKVLKDGDLVEVDADKGIIRILK